MPLSNCALCDTYLPTYPIIDTERAFCCTGCHAVFNILSTRGQLDNFQNSSIFQQALRSGLISNPILLEQIQRNRVQVPEQELERLHLEVSDMWCPACAEIIRLILLQEKGVINCVVDYSTDLASIEYSPRYISKDKIFEKIQSFGYQPNAIDSGRSAVSRSLYLRFAIAAFCALNAMMFAYPLYATYFDHDGDDYGHLFAWLSFFSALPVVTYCAWPILKRFMTSLKVGLYGMETLIVIGVTTAFGLSLYELSQDGTRVYFDSLTVIIAFVLLGKIIESRAKFSAKDSLFRLAKALPRRGRKRFPDGSVRFVPIKDIAIGDLVVAFAGEKVVLDGVVIEGEASCDESLMTGESLPVSKSVGKSILGGSIVQNGTIVYRVTSDAENSALHKIFGMVQQEIGHKTVYVRAADQIVRWFVPCVLALAAGTAFVTWWLGISDGGSGTVETAIIRAISVLLISCPCAIGIAAPLAEAHIMNGLAAMGAIVRNRGCLALLGSETAFVFDKTGTITEGKFRVLSGLAELSPEQRALLKGLSSQSLHPIASAIAQSIEEEPSQLHRVEEHAGRGLRGYDADKVLLLGSEDFLRQHGVSVPGNQQIAREGIIITTVYFAYEGQCLAVLALGDRIKELAREVVKSLGQTKTVLLSGDSKESVACVAGECGFKEWHARCSPLEKREFIEGLRKQGYIVCMLGDGINDAPALTAAQVGISVVTATDISIQVSDVLLTTDRLAVLPKIRKLAKKGQAIISQNLFWAFFYNAIGLLLAAFGLLSPIFAAFAMVASSLMVLFNAMRCK